MYHRQFTVYLVNNQFQHCETIGLEITLDSLYIVQEVKKFLGKLADISMVDIGSVMGNACIQVLCPDLFLFEFRDSAEKKEWLHLYQILAEPHLSKSNETPNLKDLLDFYFQVNQTCSIWNEEENRMKRKVQLLAEDCIKLIQTLNRDEQSTVGHLI